MDMLTPIARRMVALRKHGNSLNVDDAKVKLHMSRMDGDDGDDEHEVESFLFFFEKMQFKMRHDDNVRGGSHFACLSKKFKMRHDDNVRGGSHFACLFKKFKTKHEDNIRGGSHFVYLSKKFKTRHKDNVRGGSYFLSFKPKYK
tara:strand:- start:1341 stop:1772 length:432 start_codon:yes stop_codon:yes gene_type:complete